MVLVVHGQTQKDGPITTAHTGRNSSGQTIGGTNYPGTIQYSTLF
jgi:hypothetical protein